MMYDLHTLSHPIWNIFQAFCATLKNLSPMLNFSNMAFFSAYLAAHCAGAWSRFRFDLAAVVCQFDRMSR